MKMEELKPQANTISTRQRNENDHLQLFHWKSTLKFLCLLHLILLSCGVARAHNILRLENVRQAKFVLRHVDKVHVTAAFKELAVASVQNCLDECVTHSSCKSVNYMHNETSSNDLK